VGARYFSTFRPKVPLYAMCYNDYTMRELALVFGVNAFPFEKVLDKEEFSRKSIDILLKKGLIQKGDLIGFIGGVFGAQLGATYMELKYV
jgi:pyruvate kinase